MKGIIDSIESTGLVDGPGIRMVVFMKGCKLRCSFCHNPEAWVMEGTEITPTEIVEKLKRNINYYKNGGITFSGGEPLMQPEFLIECLKLCKKEGIHTALDTAGVGIGKYEKILEYTDLVMLDIKDFRESEYENLTGSKISEYNKFIEILKKLGTPIWIRQVVIPGINNNTEYMTKLKEYITTFTNIVKVELLPYHTYGVDKYKKLGIPYKLDGIPPLSQNELDKYKKVFE